MPRTYSDATKAKAVEDLKSGRKTPKEIKAELKITSGMLSKWRIKYEAQQAMKGEVLPPEQTPAPIETEASKEGRRKRTDDDVKVRAVAEYRKGRPAKEIGAEIGVSEASVYAWNKQLKNKEKKQGAASGVLAQLTPSIAGMDAGRMMLNNALGCMYKIQCPHCGQTFQADPPGMTETLVTLAAHLLRGEGP